MSKSEIRSARAGRGLVLLLAAWAAAGAPALAAVEAPGTAVGADPSAGAVTLALRELWRVGGDDEDQLFGVIGTVLAGENGDLYLMDAKPFDASGWHTYRVVGDQTHFRAYANEILVTHGHKDAAGSGFVGLRLNGTGTVLLEWMQVQPVR